MRPMLLRVVLLVALLLPIVPVGATLGVERLPDEPGTVVLPDAAILQTAVSDVDGDGRRELIRLVRGADDSAVAEVWVERGEEWTILGDPVEVVPPAVVDGRLDPVYQATPVRLLVRHVDGAERVTVASQPHFEEIDVGEPCCLLLHDLVIAPGELPERRAVAAPGDFTDALLVIDFDGDGTDELLATRSLPPLGDIGFPSLGRVYRWNGESFRPPTLTELPIGSGDAPFLLGDSDGLPGEEAAIISTLGRPGLFRVSADEDDRLQVDAAGLAADSATAVPLDGSRGIAAVGPGVGLMVAPWPPGDAAGAPLAESRLSVRRLLGTVRVDGQERLVAHRPESGTLHLLDLPTLVPWRDTSVARSPAAATISARPPVPFTGFVGDGLGVFHAGRLVRPSDVDGDIVPLVVSTLAGAEPIGLVRGGSALALHHAPYGPAAPGPGGGPLVVPEPAPLSWTSVAPLGQVLGAELGRGNLEPPTSGAIALDEGNDVAVGRDGFTVSVEAPAGSRVLVTDGAAVGRRPLVVPDSGRTEVRLGVGEDDGDGRRRTRLVVTTPAGRAYLAAWDVVSSTAPPPLDLMTSTRLGSTEVLVRGRTLPFARVTVAGRPVEVQADGRFTGRVALPPWPTAVSVAVDDTLGNRTEAQVTGVGVFDYRGLPWLPIVGMLAATAAIVLLLRVPRSVAAPRAAEDDAALEELRPD